MGVTQEEIALLTGIPPQRVQAQVENVIAHYLAKAAKQYPEHASKFKPLTASYNLKGGTAGRAVLAKNEIRVNLGLLLDPLTAEEMCTQTIPHEVAHFVHHWIYPHDREWHGHNWKQIMLRFGLNPERCHDMKIKPARKTRKFKYYCPANCGRIHTVGLHTHKRIQHEGARYHCTYCGDMLYDQEWEEVTESTT
jgi:predicted SprT family Zn-dependent metalloprotease